MRRNNKTQIRADFETNDLDSEPDIFESSQTHFHDKRRGKFDNEIEIG